MKAEIVIGLLFGDEGKGITTDYLCSRSSEKTIVVRFSGGQQAGHNVKIGDISHVHSSYGSGTLRGIPTYLSEYCTFYPVSIHREYKSLLTKGINDPKLYLHPLTKMTTPADVAFNRIREKKLKHGSCGIGVGATMSRTEKTGYKTYAMDLNNLPMLNQKIDQIYKYYFDQLEDARDMIDFADYFYQEKEAFNKAVDNLDFYIAPYDFLRGYDHFVFEGSQGVLLDMDHGVFPNVTYANTTSRNALEICKKLGMGSISVYYVTRCYQTRHGNGWMSSDEEIKLINNGDEINKINRWQGEFRIREIDYSLINHAIAIDSIYSSDPYIRKNLVVTCLDQRPDFQFDYSKIESGSDIVEFIESYSPDSSGMKTFGVSQKL